jgi:hypothetical protein
MARDDYQNSVIIQTFGEMGRKAEKVMKDKKRLVAREGRDNLPKKVSSGYLASSLVTLYQ